MLNESSLSEITFRNLPFRADYTFDCGQAFRWNRLDENGNDWLGIVLGNLVRVTNHSFSIIGASKTSSEIAQALDVERYLSLDRDLDTIVASFPESSTLDSAVTEYYGLRVLRQDPWECLISFLCSINCNIPSIKFRIENICRRFGTRIESGALDGRYYSFPSPEALARADKRELLSCKLGFRWKYVRHVSREVSAGNLDLNSLTQLPYEFVSRELISEKSGKTFGVGPKVADCVSLFSLDKLEAFPIDIWMMRCLNSFYPDLAKWSHSEYHEQLSQRKYLGLSRAIRAHFGPYAGYAQQYLYMWIRSNSFKKKSRLEGKRK